MRKKVNQKTIRNEMEECSLIKMALCDERETLKKQQEQVYSDKEKIIMIQYEQEQIAKKLEEEKIKVQLEKNAFQQEIYEFRIEQSDWEEEQCYAIRKQYDVLEKERAIEKEIKAIQELRYSVEQEQMRIEEERKQLALDTIASCIQNKYIAYHQKRIDEARNELFRIQLSNYILQRQKQLEYEHQYESFLKEKERVEHKHQLLLAKQEKLNAEQNEFYSYIDQLIKTDDENGFISKEELQTAIQEQKATKCILM